MREKVVLIFQSLFKPAETYRIIQANPERDASLLLATILPISMAFPELINPKTDVWVKVLLLAGGIVITVLSVVLFAHLLNWISGIFKKTDVANSLRLAIPYAFVPAIIVNFLSLALPAEIAIWLRLLAVLWVLISLTAFVSELKNLDRIRSFTSVFISVLIWSLPVLVFKIIWPLMAARSN